MADEESTYEADREIWRKLYKSFVMENDEIDNVLEEKSLYWNDDKEIVDTFVIKTIKRFEPGNSTEQELLPEYKDDEDKDFARKLSCIYGCCDYADCNSGNVDIPQYPYKCHDK